MKKKKKLLSLFVLLGLSFNNVEILFRALIHDGINLSTPYRSLIGWTSLWMIPVGGLCGVALGYLNEKSCFRKRTLVFQSFIGMFIILLIELTSGLVLNRLFDMGVWDYSGWPLNLWGQICAPVAVVWFLMGPLVFWLDDVLRHYMYDETKPDSLLLFYKRFFTLKK